ncbi:MAG: hypothetical protein KAJ51_10425, partial [Thermoplasmata archaeon]|nr:hypothetical protein [Thermoplasmata archaeon]
KMMENMFSGTENDRNEGSMASIMPQMMIEMMPYCINLMLPSVPKKERVEFIKKMVDTLIEKGSYKLSEEEKKDLMARVLQ